MKKFEEILEESTALIKKTHSIATNLMEALTGEHGGHRHEYDAKKGGTTSAVDGHSHSYEMDAKMTGEGGDDKHTHSLTSDPEEGKDSDKKSDKKDDKDDDKKDKE